MTFKEQIQQGIPSELPQERSYRTEINHAPKRKEILSKEEKELALKNALRYFYKEHHRILAKEFLNELDVVYICIGSVHIIKCMRVQ